MKNEEKTGYNWCLDANMRILDLQVDEEKEYFCLPVDKKYFMNWLINKEVKPNSTPRKTETYLEYRMYILVPYNISPIQAGIQALHSVVEYGQNVKGMGGLETRYDLWANEWKTVIVCNGGTTNNDREDKWYGSLQQASDKLTENNVPSADFYEPDLNNALTAVAFLVDERVFNDKLYPDYEETPKTWATDSPMKSEHVMDLINKWESDNAKNRAKWVEKIGNEKNDFLRKFLKPLRLANN